MIEIVSHAYAGDLPQYAVFLRVQLSSLVVWRPMIDFRITVCYSPEDEKVFDVLDSFQVFLSGNLRTIRLDKTALFRRAIGRNAAALTTKADLVWFTDVDHMFGQGCLDELFLAWQELKNGSSPPSLIWPSGLMIHKDHKKGDEFWRKNVETRGNLIPDLTEFELKHYRGAIGGVQIVPGDFCRKHGYLNGNKKFLRRTDGKKPFPSFRDDVRFRKFCEENGGSKKINLSGLYRLRHTETTYQ